MKIISNIQVMHIYKINKIKLLIIASIFISSYGFSQTKEIQIEFIGNCGLHMTDGITNFYIDFPYNLELMDIWNLMNQN